MKKKYILHEIEKEREKIYTARHQEKWEKNIYLLHEIKKYNRTENVYGTISKKSGRKIGGGREREKIFSVLISQRIYALNN